MCSDNEEEISRLAKTFQPNEKVISTRTLSMGRVEDTRLARETD